MAEPVTATPTAESDEPKVGPWAAFLRATKTALAVVGAVTVFATGYVTISGLAGQEETYSRAEAAKFADAYLTTAPLDPGRARNTLTTEVFQSLDQAQDPEYTRWWKTVDSVDIQGVSRTSEKNVFRVDYVLSYSSGATEKVRSHWLLTCVDQLRKYLPFTQCRSRALRLDDVSRPPEE
jgi:hypothetical protein